MSEQVLYELHGKYNRQEENLFFFYCIRCLHLQAEDKHAFAAFEMEFTPLIPSRIPVQYDWKRNKIQQQSSEHIIRCRTLPELWSHVFTPQASSEIFQASLSSLPVPLEYIYWWVREFQLYGKIKTKQLFFFLFCELIINAQPSTRE